MTALADVYLWLKALHLIAVIAWMAGLLYLPRLFVYHCAAEPDSVQDETFKVMERRLLQAIMTPAMIATWILGMALLAAAPAWFSHGWLHVKLVLVVAMTVMHMMQASWRSAFAAGRNTRSERFYRIMNEVPAVMMVIIVIMVIVKPF